MKTNFYLGALAIISIGVLFETISGILLVATAYWKLNIYITPVIMIAFSVIAVCVFAFRLEEIKDIKLWFFILLSLFFIAPKNFFYVFSYEELTRNLTATGITGTVKMLLYLSLLIISYIKYQRIKKHIKKWAKISKSEVD